MATKKKAVAAQWPAGFTDADRAMFERIGVPAELTVDAGIRRVTDREARRYRLVGRGNMAGLLFPYSDPQADELVTCRVRRDNPEPGKNGKPDAKYMTPPADKARRILYYPPDAKAKLEGRRDIYFVLVEAEKSALALTAWAARTGSADRVLFIAMGGCWGWSQDNKPLADLTQLDGRSVLVLLDANVKTNAKVRDAQDTLVAELRRRQCDVHTLALPQIEGVNGPDDLLAQPDGDALMARVFDERAQAVVSPFSEDALATRFAEEQKDTLRYVKAWGQWLVWDGTRWKPEDRQQVAALVQDFCLAAATECPTPTEQKRIRSGRTREIVQREAGAKPLLAATVDQWDADLWLLATPDGTVDLRTGELRPARREDYCTKLAGAKTSAAKPVRWLQFLNEITQGDKELQAYMQRVAGHCLTGDTSEHALFFFYGTGANGKSVFVKTILGVLGDYAKVAQMDTFTATHHPQHPTDVATLRGARLVTATETEEGSRWAEAKLKAMTGGEPVTARFMRQDFFTFVPQFKPMISGNHRPKLRNVDEAMRRRIHLVPFNATFAGKQRDPKLAEKLRAEWPGILQWAVDGCLAWKRDGLRAPAAVLAATEDYLDGQDVLGMWLEAAVEKDPKSKAQSGDLYRVFKGWAEARGEYVCSQNQFTQKLVERGYKAVKSHGDRYIAGLRLKSSTGGGRTGQPIPITAYKPKTYKFTR